MIKSVKRLSTISKEHKECNKRKSTNARNISTGNTRMSRDNKTNLTELINKEENINLKYTKKSL